MTSSQDDIDLRKLWQEANLRWLRPTEIYEVLINHSRFSISKEPLTLPPSGTLVLFNRKILRNFRRDGHPWRKRKDNKTVKEAHEYLKVGSEEKIHVYYAHGEGDSNLQRRSYWLLDKALEHIVLVHYLEVREIKTNMLMHHGATSFSNLHQESYHLYAPAIGTHYTFNEPVVSSDSGGPISDYSYTLSEPNSDEKTDFDTFYIDDLQSTGETSFDKKAAESQWPDKTVGPYCEKVIKQDSENVNGIRNDWDGTLQFSSGTSTQACYDNDHTVAGLSIPGSTQQFEVVLHDAYDSQVHTFEASNLSTVVASGEKGDRQGTHDAELSMQMQFLQNNEDLLKKLDSFDRWMQRELPAVNQTSSVGVSNDSCFLGTSLHIDKTTNDEAEAIRQPSVTEMTLCTPQIFFEITDYSPTWSFSSEDSKVIITGHFNGNPVHFHAIDWYCMFGGKEIHMDVIQSGVLRFKIPKDVSPGMISFYITDSSREPCSDVKHFVVKDIIQPQKQSVGAAVEQDFHNTRLQYRFARLVLDGGDHLKVGSHRDMLPVASRSKHLVDTVEQEWSDLNNSLENQGKALPDIKEQLMILILKCMMVSEINKMHRKDGKSWQLFDSSGQCILHLASALGYEWLINIVKASGMSIDFRDKKGWTALHWAAHYGRERMVAALLAAGSKPGAITDPTPENTSGCTPADIAAAAGHDGLAGYLSEQNLAYHLKTLTLDENEHDKKIATDEGYRIMEALKRSISLRRTVHTSEDEQSLEESISAMVNATMSSARIYAAFKEYLMRQQLQSIEERDEYGFTLKEKLAVQKIQKAYKNHREMKRKENAALHIQNCFRVWKTRRNFLTLRSNVIRIQAYFRMHRARRLYHKLVWSVGVLEKALLRWRKRAKGLRGYHPEFSTDVDSGNGNDFLQIGRKQAEAALERSVVLVQSMVRSKIARQQYSRMKENFKQAKIYTTTVQDEDYVMS
ncbi:hypothetical protein KP509_07G061900 [Ceratopteris richardii]|nr:hypothetical protein KP509_07G061900 [Ceratopteris richardii]